MAIIMSWLVHVRRAIQPLVLRRERSLSLVKRAASSTETNSRRVLRFIAAGCAVFSSLRRLRGKILRRGRDILSRSRS